jgi:hypothetical protein
MNEIETNRYNFCTQAIEEMESHGVSVLVDLENTHVPLMNGMMCNGYFVDSPFSRFAVGAGKDEDLWFPIFIHEYCHFTQWRDKIPEWSKLWKDGIYYDDFLDRWTGGEKFSDEIIDDFIDAGIAIESDCECRVVELLKQNVLGIDPKEYAQRANAYVHFYNYIRLNQKWYKPGKEPYNIKDVWSQFNTEIDYDFSVSWEYLTLFEKYCM